ncbi:LAMI_0C06898g1_1 [Lachancea mirantina]|uniref:Carboxypeptidase n=1 Tax=Lachancea mirantina TaxID=1230905 RepID=A0A1G4J3J8_9SACH|nr:LAMI_0C06898g1_1 [Lachancea mirantina]
MVSVRQLVAGVTALGSASAFSVFSEFERAQNDFSVVNPVKNALQSIRKPNPNAGFSVFKTDKDDDYRLRIKTIDPEKLGIDTVKQYSGYLDFQDSKHFFYWMFESRNDPENDPVILWLNGGPGCSSFTGLFFELGSSSIDENLSPVFNPYSWNNNATVIFLEQPLGVGFSYGNEKVTSTRAAGKDVYIFLELFYQKFPLLRRNALHIAGESYAGHYIPQIAHEIVVSHGGDRTFNLTSILIGNGITDSLVQNNYYKPMACGEGGYEPVLTEHECERMDRDIGLCNALTRNCYSQASAFACIAAQTYCDRVTLEPYQKTELNFYDIRGPCETDGGLCYREIDYIEKFMNQPFVQEALGSEVSKYEGCSNDVGIGFVFTGDGSRPFHQYVAELLDEDIPVLIYAGDKDYICNWLGNLAWTNELDWEFRDQYEYLPLKPWKTKETTEVAGQVKNFGPLTFLRVYDAGHMVPYNQPEHSLEMVNTWLFGDRSYGY